MSSAMELSQNALEQIGEYVKRHLPEWQRETSAAPESAAGLSPEMVRREIELGERIVRVEEELKTQRDLIREGFAGMNKRFEEQTASINARFDDVNKRFEEQLSYFNKRFEEQTASTNARFDDVNKRFEDMRSYTNRWMLLISLFLGMIGAMPWIMGAY